MNLSRIPVKNRRYHHILNLGLLRWLFFQISFEDHFIEWWSTTTDHWDCRREYLDKPPTILCVFSYDIVIILSRFFIEKKVPIEFDFNECIFVQLRFHLFVLVESIAVLINWFSNCLGEIPALHLIGEKKEKLSAILWSIRVSIYWSKKIPRRACNCYTAGNLISLRARSHYNLKRMSIKPYFLLKTSIFY